MPAPRVREGLLCRENCSVPAGTLKPAGRPHRPLLQMSA